MTSVRRQRQDDGDEINDKKKEDSIDIGMHFSKDDFDKTIFSENNHVYFYTAVTNDSILSLQKVITKVVKTLNQQIEETRSMGLTATLSPIYLHINSQGGSIFACFAFLDFLTQIKLQNKNLKVYSVVEGRAASAGSLMSVVCDKRFIGQNSYILIHQLSAGTFGKYYEMKDSMKNYDSFMKKIKEIYLKFTKIPAKELDKILEHDLYFDAKLCLKYNLVDHLIDKQNFLT